MSTHRFISSRAASVDASGIRRAFDLAAKLKDPINLSIGLPDFDVPEVGKVAAVDAIKSGQNRYTQTQGIAPLRDRLARDLSAEFGRRVDDVLITSGVSGGLMLVMMAVLDAGDEAVFLDPYFVMYRQLLSLIGARGVGVDSYPDFRFHADRVEAAITPRTKMMILNSPSNPTGVLMTRPEIEAAVALCRKHNLLLVSDEIYELFTYERGIPSPASLYENTVVLRGFSKTHAMTGWRLGYAAGPGDVLAQMTKLQQYTFVCAPSPFQHGALAALDADMSTTVESYRRKRDIVVERLSKKFELVVPGGAFYVFPKCPAGITGNEFMAKAIENNVIIIAGNVFSSADTHYRVSFATSDERLIKGCDVLCSLA